jgi:1,4-dihydroxy-2-naphthoate octaprenyltransferase
MNLGMWKKALLVIPSVTKEEWGQLDIVSKWLISTRAAVLIMTFLSAALAGIFAIRNNTFQFLPWLVMTLGLVLAHATNNLFNDYTDFNRGVDKDNYFRTLYGPQPLASGLMTNVQLLTYTAFTGFFAAVMGILLIYSRGGDAVIWWLFGLGVFFVLFYTWPLKYIALGEIAVLIVWGPLMIGGGYYVMSGYWDWMVVLASLPYVLGVTTVIFGKHIDKSKIDKEKKIYTLPVIIGEKTARYAVLGMMLLSYILVLVLIITRYFTPAMLLVLAAIPSFQKVYPAFLKPRPETRPADFPDGQGGWPLYFAPLSFLNNRAFGMFFLLGLILDSIIRVYFPLFWN